MNSIEWIQHLPDTPTGIDIHRLVDSDLAVDISKNECLGIDRPEERVGRFIASIPSLIIWFRTNYRVFPWRRSRDPWEVLFAEILLQRTRAENVSNIYPDLLNRYPSPYEVFEATDRELFDSVKSLGFGNKRTTTLREVSKTLVIEYGGEVPNDLGALQELPRIGPYTARACVCFAYGAPRAIIDSNVGVVLRRVFNYSSNNRPHKDQALYIFMDALVPSEPDLARAFNLALLDLRDAICRDPPQCPKCPLHDGCHHGSHR